MMQTKIAVAIIFITGIIVLIGSIVNWKLMFENKKANFFTRKFGKNADRFAYGIIGFIIILMGIYAIYSGKLNAPLE